MRSPIPPLFGALLMLLAWRPAFATLYIDPAEYKEAQTHFVSDFTVSQRITLQVLLTTAGYWNAVPNADFSIRLFKAITQFQMENGFAPNGQVDATQVNKLAAVAGPILNQWGFRVVKHPTRNHSIWVPFGLNLTAERNEYGLRYSDARNRITIDFTTVPNVSIPANYFAVLNVAAGKDATIHYKVFKESWFAISASTPDGVDWYFRYHQDDANVTGVTLQWDNANGDVHGDRIASLMSASLWADMTGAPFIDPPGSASDQPSAASTASPDANASSTPTAPAQENASAAPGSNSQPMISTGSGFFVSADGSFVTNEHVIDGCTKIAIRLDGAFADATVVAADKTNDLSLLHLSKTPKKVAVIRLGVRVGEQVETFGFPHADMLSTSGNFTLGNVTALTGLGDDSRYLQISAPVQAGNSGGPLLDQGGNLVGVVSAKLNALKVAENNGDLPQNVNFAVKAATLAEFLDSNRVKIQTGTLDKTMQPADIADEARAMSGFVMCQ